MGASIASLMNRRAFVTGLGAVLAAPRAAGAQQAGKVWRIGWLAAGRRNENDDLVEALREGLRDAGFVEGRNLLVEFRWAEERYGRLPDLAVELIRLGADVIFAPGDPQAHGAKQATTNIPIVFTGATDPVANGFVASLSRPGGNMTGLTLSDTKVTGKRLSLLKDAIPTLTRVGILSNPGMRPHHLAVSEASAHALGLQSRVFQTVDREHLGKLFSRVVSDHVEAVLLLPDSMLYQERTRLAQLALHHRLAMIGWRSGFAHAGSLLSYGGNIHADFRRAGVLIGKILNGAKPAEIPVEEPTKFELVINLKTAKALGLTIPPSLLARADQVIE
jgi:putative ABC transport system substrate-binding protein